MDFFSMQVLYLLLAVAAGVYLTLYQLASGKVPGTPAPLVLYRAGVLKKPGPPPWYNPGTALTLPYMVAAALQLSPAETLWGYLLGLVGGVLLGTIVLAIGIGIAIAVWGLNKNPVTDPHL